MRLHSYRDESHSRHFDLIGGGSHRWSIDLVYVTASAILVVGFACALMAHRIYEDFARRVAEVGEPGRLGPMAVGKLLLFLRSRRPRHRSKLRPSL